MLDRGIHTLRDRSLSTNPTQAHKDQLTVTARINQPHQSPQPCVPSYLHSPPRRPGWSRPQLGPTGCGEGPGTQHGAGRDPGELPSGCRPGPPELPSLRERRPSPQGPATDSTGESQQQHQLQFGKREFTKVSKLLFIVMTIFTLKLLN